MKKLLTVFLLFFVMNFVYGQSIVISSTVFDQAGKTIPYVNIYIKGERKGTVTNKIGQFDLEINQEDLSKSLVISAIGFEPQMIEIANHPAEIFLKENIYDLNEIVVFSGKEKVIEVGNLEFPKSGNTVEAASVGKRIPTGFMSAIFMENPSTSKGRFKTISFFIGARGKHKTPFRIKVYSKDKTAEKPDSLLVQKDIIVKAKKKGSWLQIDVSSYNIPFPVNGAYVAMEWLHDEKKYQYTRKFKHRGKKIKSYGQTLGYYSKEPKYRNWSHYLGFGWQEEVPTFKSLIKAQVAVYE